MSPLLSVVEVLVAMASELVAPLDLIGTGIGCLRNPAAIMLLQFGRHYIAH